MGRALRRQGPALVVAGLALIAALGGTVYAAGKVNGRTIKIKSLPGNRLTPGSVAGNRLKPGAIKGAQLAPGSITGIQVDTSTLGQVPSAIHAETAESAHDAETALNAANAENARTVNGFEAGCKPGSRPFAGACWQNNASAGALNAPTAAEACAAKGGELPDALSLAAFSQEGVALQGDEWSGDITNVSGADLYAVITVSPSAEVNSALSTATRKFRCVFPLVG
jgi:hypothetical protein